MQSADDREKVTPGRGSDREARGANELIFCCISVISRNSVRARSHSANGWISPDGNWSFSFDPWPGVTSDVYLSDGEPHGGIGVPGTFVFSPPAGWTEVDHYRYSFNGEDFFDAPAGPDGRASVTWTPETSGWVNLDVYVIGPNDTWGDYGNYYQFLVA